MDSITNTLAEGYRKMHLSRSDHLACGRIRSWCEHWRGDDLPTNWATLCPPTGRFLLLFSPRALLHLQLTDVCICDREEEGETLMRAFRPVLRQRTHDMTDASFLGGDPPRGGDRPTTQRSSRLIGLVILA